MILRHSNAIPKRLNQAKPGTFQIQLPIPLIERFCAVLQQMAACRPHGKFCCIALKRRQQAHGIWTSQTPFAVRVEAQPPPSDKTNSQDRVLARCAVGRTTLVDLVSPPSSQAPRILAGKQKLTLSRCVMRVLNALRVPEPLRDSDAGQQKIRGTAHQEDHRSGDRRTCRLALQMEYRRPRADVEQWSETQRAIRRHTPR